jgi:hypothetical protein
VFKLFIQITYLGRNKSEDEDNDEKSKMETAEPKIEEQKTEEKRHPGGKKRRDRRK